MISGKRRLGVLLVTSLLCLVGPAAFGPGAATAQTCTDNPDGSSTCTSTFPNPPGVPCPTTFNGTVSVSPGLVVDIPAGANVVGHLLTFQCPGSTTSESFDPNASSPAAPPGYQTARDDFSATCNLMSGCAGGSVSVRLDVTYFSPSTLPPALPRPEDVIVPQKVRVDPKSGKGRFGVYTNRPLPLTIDRPAILTQKGHGTCWRSDQEVLLDINNAPSIAFKLNRGCLRTLDGKGKLTVEFGATLRNSAGSIPFTRRLKLVKKKR